MNKFTNKMTWNVYIYRHGNDIQTYNIFEHRHFVEYLNKIDFDSVMAQEKVRRELYYYFGGKAECEVYISDIFGFMEEREFEKVSIYDQVMLNFDKFFKYLLEVRNEQKTIQKEKIKTIKKNTKTIKKVTKESITNAC